MTLRDWLLRSRGRLVADLNTDDIIDQLVGPGLISAAEEAEIDGLETRQLKARRLVRLITLRDSEELLAAFHTALKADYLWLTTLPDSNHSLAAALSRSSGDLSEIGVDGAITIPQLAACSRTQASPSSDAQKDSVFQIHPLVPSSVLIEADRQVPSGFITSSRPIEGISGIEVSINQSQPIRSGRRQESADFGSPSNVESLTHSHIDQVASNAIALDSWRGIARDLGVTEDDIASVQSRLPFDLRAQCYEVLRIWAADYEGASLSVLVSVLRKNQLNRLATRLGNKHINL